MTPILVEVVAPMLSGREMRCMGCSVLFGSTDLKRKYRDDIIDKYPDNWKESVGYLSTWISEIARLYRHRVRIHVIDAQSPLGFWKQIRHRVFRFPAFIVDRKGTYIGWDSQELETLIDERIHRAG